MGSITDLSSLINKVSGGGSGTREQIWWHKTQRIAGVTATTPTSGRLHSLWRYDGQPSGGAVPTSIATCDNTLDGGLKQASNTAGFQKYMYQFGVTPLSPATFILYDRLLHIGGLSGTTTTAQTVQGATPSVTLTRYNTNATSVGNLILVEIYTAIGATATTITASYTNQDGTASRTTQATTFGGTTYNAATRAILLPLQSGDTGVQVVKDVTVLASTGTAGNFGVSIIRPLAICGSGIAGVSGFRDFTVSLPGIPEVISGACLAMLMVPNASAINELLGCVSLVEA